MEETLLTIQYLNSHEAIVELKQIEESLSEDEIYFFLYQH